MLSLGFIFALALEPCSLQDVNLLEIDDTCYFKDMWFRLGCRNYY